MDLGGTVARAAGETLGDQGGGTRSCVAAGGVRLGELDGRCTCRHRKGRTVDQLVSVTVRRSTEVRVHDMLGPQCGKLETHIRKFFFCNFKWIYFLSVLYISDV